MSIMNSLCWKRTTKWPGKFFQPLPEAAIIILKLMKFNLRDKALIIAIKKGLKLLDAFYDDYQEVEG